MGEGLQNTWGLEEEEEEDEDDCVTFVERKKEKGTTSVHFCLLFCLLLRDCSCSLCFAVEVMVISDSEEEVVVVLNPEAP